MTKDQKKENQKAIKIDATNQTIGRLASKVSFLLMGKNKANYLPNKKPNNKVVVENLSKVRFTGKKLEQKKYFRFTGYPGGIKSQNLKNFFNKNPEKLLINVIYNMLPKNKLRKYMIKNLIIKL